MMLVAAHVFVAAVLFLLLGQLRFGDAAWTVLWHAMGADAVLGVALYAVVWVILLWTLGLPSVPPVSGDATPSRLVEVWQ